MNDMSLHRIADFLSLFEFYFILIFLELLLHKYDFEEISNSDVL